MSDATLIMLAMQKPYMQKPYKESSLQVVTQVTPYFLWCSIRKGHSHLQVQIHIVHANM